MEEKKVLVKNLEVSYKISGSSSQILQDKTWEDKSQPFLILHGWGSKSDRWQKIGELLEQKGLKVIIPDLPGFGKSEVPLKAWNLDDYVEWVREFSEQLPELKGNFYLLGHSFGGALTAKFSIKYSQKVKKLFLVSAACIRKNTTIKKFLYKIVSWLSSKI